MTPPYRLTAIQDAKEWLGFNPLFLDTETTGTDAFAQIIEIAIHDVNGRSLIDTLVHPTIPIPLEAQHIHHIPDADVARRPDIGALDLPRLLDQRHIVIYNSPFD